MGKLKFTFILFVIFAVGCNYIPDQHDLRVALLSHNKKEEKKEVLYDCHLFTFSYPEDWVISEMKSDDGLVNLILGKRERFNYIESFSFISVQGTHDLNEMINSFYSPFEEEFAVPETEIRSSDYQGIPCLTFNFSHSPVVKEKLYSQITAFCVNEHTIAILKQSNHKDRLQNEFENIENSLKFKAIASIDK